MKIARFIPLFLLAACTLGPTYHAPAPDVPKDWSGMKSTPQAPAATEYWKQFNDPQLNALIAQAEQNNHDYKVAVLRMRKARAERVATSAAQYPEPPRALPS